MVSVQIDSAQNLEAWTQESRPGVVDGAAPMGMSLTGENRGVQTRSWRAGVLQSLAPTLIKHT